MKKKWMKWIAATTVTAMAVSLMTGCAGSTSSENGKLNLFLWTEYLPESVIEDFEKEYGIDVTVSYYSSNEDMLSKVKSEADGTYDIVQPSDYMVELMINQELLQKVDLSAIPNMSNLDPAYLDLPFDPGNTYSVPYRGGLVAIAVNTAKVDTEITSYADLFSEELAGQLVVLDDYRAIIGVAAKSLGYSMNETDPDKLAEIETRLLELKDNVKVYDSDSPKSSLISEDCTVAAVWTAEIAWQWRRTRISRSYSRRRVPMYSWITSV